MIVNKLIHSGKTMLLLLIIFSIGSVNAKVFESYNGNFYFNIPDNWSRLDYRTADHYLSQAGRGSDYEAVFIDNDSLTIFEGAYLILTLDSLGDLNQTQIDSILQVMSDGTKRPIKKIDIMSKLFSPDVENLLYSGEMKMIAVYTDLDMDTDSPRKGLLVSLFYERGIANYYFYSPQPLFETSLPSFQEMVTSFTLGRAKQQSDETVKITDLSARKSVFDNSDNMKRLYMIGGGLLLIILIAIMTTRRNKRESKIKS